MPYPTAALSAELAFVLLYCLIEPIRLYLGTASRASTGSGARASHPPISARCSPARPPARAGSRGNKTEALRPLASSLALALPVAVFHVYCLCLQTHVLQLDLVLNGVALAFLASELLCGGAAALSFAHEERLQLR